MTVTYRGGVSIFQLIVYIPCLPIAAFVAYRHGFGRSAGWIFLIIFSLLRIIGAICELVAISHFSVGVITAAVVCSTIGLSPLVLVCAGLLSRVNNFTEGRLNPLIFRGLNLLTIVGLILGIVGGSEASSESSISVNSESKAGIILFIVAYVAVVLLFFIIATRLSRIEAGEKRLLLAVGISLPFLLVRLIYSLIVAFGHNSNFSYITGSVTIFLCMAVLEEMVVIITCLVAGLTLRVAPKAALGSHEEQVAFTDMSRPGQGDMAMEAGMAPGARQDGAPRRNRDRRRRGPIHMLIGAGKDYYQSRKEGDR